MVRGRLRSTSSQLRHCPDRGSELVREGAARVALGEAMAPSGVGSSPVVWTRRNPPSGGRGPSARASARVFDAVKWRSASADQSITAALEREPRAARSRNRWSCCWGRGWERVARVRPGRRLRTRSGRTGAIVNNAGSFGSVRDARCRGTMPPPPGGGVGPRDAGASRVTSGWHGGNRSSWNGRHHGLRVVVADGKRAARPLRGRSSDVPVEGKRSPLQRWLRPTLCWPHLRLRSLDTSVSGTASPPPGGTVGELCRMADPARASAPPVMSAGIPIGLSVRGVTAGGQRPR